MIIHTFKDLYRKYVVLYITAGLITIVVVLIRNAISKRNQIDTTNLNDTTREQDNHSVESKDNNRNEHKAIKTAKSLIKLLAIAYTSAITFFVDALNTPVNNITLHNTYTPIQHDSPSYRYSGDVSKYKDSGLDTTNLFKEETAIDLDYITSFNNRVVKGSVVTSLCNECIDSYYSVFIITNSIKHLSDGPQLKAFNYGALVDSDDTTAFKTVEIREDDSYHIQRRLISRATNKAICNTNISPLFDESSESTYVDSDSLFNSYNVIEDFTGRICGILFVEE